MIFEWAAICVCPGFEAIYARANLLWLSLYIVIISCGCWSTISYVTTKIFITEYVGIKNLGLLVLKGLLLASQIPLPQTPSLQEGTHSDELKIVCSDYYVSINLLHPVQIWLKLFLSFVSQSDTIKYI